MEGDVVKAWRGSGSPRFQPGLLPARRRPASVRRVANGGGQGTGGALSGVSAGLIGPPVPPALWTEVILYVQSGRFSGGPRSDMAGIVPPDRSGRWQSGDLHPVLKHGPRSESL